MEPHCDLTSIPDDELLGRLAELLRQSRRVEADLVAHIGEVERRRLYAREAVPSMFAYCTERLHLSEAEAYLRIAAARASQEHPILLEMLRDGRLHLTAIAKLAPHLNLDNRQALLKRATHRSKRQIEELVAELAPRPDAPALMRKLPERMNSKPAPTLELRPNAVAASAARIHSDSRTASAPVLAKAVPVEPVLELRPDGVTSSAPEHQFGPTGRTKQLASVDPLAPGRYKVQFTASAALHDKLERLRALLRTSVPDADLAAIIELAVSEKLDRLEARRFAKAKRPSQAVPRTDPGLRHIPAAVRRAVHTRDQGRCRYVDEQGRRCTARDQLEFHHHYPFALGGDCGTENIRLLCRNHNQYLAEVDYGRQAISRHRRSLGRVSDASAVHSSGLLTPGGT